MTYYIDHLGFEFEVVGDYDPIEGLDVTDILLDGQSCVDILDWKVDDAICEKAEDTAREEYMGWYR